MGRMITVGRGFGKYSFNDAVLMGKEGDTILLEPGHYAHTDGYTTKHLKLRGLGKEPNDVVINTDIYEQRSLHAASSSCHRKITQQSLRTKGQSGSPPVR